jgi:6-phosphogluconolactonase
VIEAEWWEHDDTEALAEAVAGDIGFIIESALDARSACLLALSGGRTPVAAYEKLAAMKFDWKRVTIIPGDDRLVAVTDPLSNAGMLAKLFIPRGARVVPLNTDNPDVKAAGNAADARMQDLKWPPDLVLLGVGPDGHTASILPGPDMEAALDAPKTRRAIGVTPDPLPKEAPVARVTMTRAGILQARALMLILTGAEKRALVEQAIEDGASSKYAIGRVLAEAEQAIDIHWAP